VRGPSVSRWPWLGVGVRRLRKLTDCSLWPWVATAVTLGAHIALIKSAFTSLCELADLFPNPTKEELYAVGLHFYGHLLKDEASELDLVGPTLPVIKLLCERGFATVDLTSPPNQSLAKAVHGLLSASLQNIDETRARQACAATTKTRNNLLAVVVVLTALPPSAKVGREVVERACFLIGEAALGEGEVRKTALYCATSLVAAGLRGSASGVVQYCVGRLMPCLVELVARAGEEGRAWQAGEPRLVGLTEAVKALGLVVGAVPAERRTEALSVVMPALIMLLQPEAPTAPAVHQIGLKQLLALAAQDAASFRECTHTLEEEMRAALEASVRSSVGGGAKGRGMQVERRVEPRVVLKSFG